MNKLYTIKELGEMVDGYYVHNSYIIYFEFFNSEKIANIPILMAKSEKKFTADEILLIFKTIHMFAYLVINTQIKKHIWEEDLLAEKGVLPPFLCAAFPPFAFLADIVAFYKSKDL